jgi:hypothetical protein
MDAMRRFPLASTRLAATCRSRLGAVTRGVGMLA